MGGGQQEAHRASSISDAVEKVNDAVVELMVRGAYDRAFGVNPQIVEELNVTLARYGLRLEKLR